MASTIVSLTLALAAGAGTWQGNAPSRPVSPRPHAGGRIVVDGPGNGWGFPNNNPDGYGHVDFGTALPLSSNRIAEYYFPRYFAVPANQAFLPSYYNPYLTRGQRYVSYAGCGSAADHPMSGPPMASAVTPIHPYQESIGRGARVPVPPFSGRIEAPPIDSGSTGLTP
jgi:hypothetical protein